MHVEFPSRLAVAACAAVLLASPAVAQRQLHWRELRVEARLEADGTLRVAERQAMVFSGDWNGGERSFRRRLGQRLTLDRLVRLDPSRGEVPLVEGDLSAVDSYGWKGRDLLRWRSRLPDDPPFDRSELVYRIDYRLDGILRRSGERFVLDHDFAFADRVGEIERFVLDLELAPQWRAVSPLEAHSERAHLVPGESFVVRAELEHLGGAAVSTAPAPLDSSWALGVLGLFVAGVAYFLLRFVAREQGLGRFGGPQVGPVDRAFLDRVVFALRPEEIGAAWDRRVGQAEVAATLARLVAEGKLESEVKKERVLLWSSDNLHLRLLVPREDLEDYERRLVDGLFPLGDETDTKSLRQHYAGRGFDPAGRIRQLLQARIARRPFDDRSPKPRAVPTLALLGAGVALAAGAAVSSPAGLRYYLVAVCVLLAAYLCGLFGALALRSQLQAFFAPGCALGCGLVVALAAIVALGRRPGVAPLGAVGVALVGLGVARSLFNLAKTREGAEAILRRRELAAARRWFVEELRRPRPTLDDAWYPYLIAFGLAPQMDRWFRAFGVESATVTRRGTAWSGGEAGSGGGWSGGGGAFGGGGASASWAMAATAFSAGVSSSSSSGGGGGGGGSSSGGGGGGGW
jgi:uncharacterized membrane protein YgcG